MRRDLRVEGFKTAVLKLMLIPKYFVKLSLFHCTWAHTQTTVMLAKLDEM